MGDLISRQAAIDEVINWLNDRMTDGKNGKPLTERLKDLPSAQPEHQWIPCGERLPGDGTEVFVYLYHNPKSPYIAWIEDSRWYTEEFAVDREYEPLAWMPLPEPYGEGEQDG